MSEMIERVAKAIHGCEAWSSFWDMSEARILARAAIAAMREPTDDMALAGSDHMGDARECWQAMIDDAVRSGGCPGQSSLAVTPR